MDFVRGPLLGRGSFATVNLAFLPSDHHKLFAVKSSPLRNSHTLRWENSVLSQLKHCPHIVRCFGGGTVPGVESYNLLLEYVPGGSLADVVSARGVLPEANAKRYLRSILAGVGEVHRSGFVHCDLKPTNILVVDEWNVKIADFGLARRKSDRGGCSFTGTPGYVAPESIVGNHYETPADIWAVGCVAVEMMTGRPPWAGIMTAEALVLRVGCRGECPRVPVELSEECKDFLRRCFERDPRRRWTAEMLLEHSFVAEEEECMEVGGGSPKTVLDFDEWVCEERWFPTKASPGLSPVEEERVESRVRELATAVEREWNPSEEGGWIFVRGDGRKTL